MYINQKLPQIVTIKHLQQQQHNYFHHLFQHFQGHVVQNQMEVVQQHFHQEVLALVLFFLNDDVDVVYEGAKLRHRGGSFLYI